MAIGFDDRSARSRFAISRAGERLIAALVRPGKREQHEPSGNGEQTKPGMDQETECEK